MNFFFPLRTVVHHATASNVKTLQINTPGYKDNSAVCQISHPGPAFPLESTSEVGWRCLKQQEGKVKRCNGLEFFFLLELRFKRRMSSALAPLLCTYLTDRNMRRNNINLWIVILNKCKGVCVGVCMEASHTVP